MLLKIQHNPHSSECQSFISQTMSMESTTQNQLLPLQNPNPAYNYSVKHLQKCSHASPSQLTAATCSLTYNNNTNDLTRTDTHPETTLGIDVPVYADPENLSTKVSAYCCYRFYNNIC